MRAAASARAALGQLRVRRPWAWRLTIETRAAQGGQQPLNSAAGPSLSAAHPRHGHIALHLPCNAQLAQSET